MRPRVIAAIGGIILTVGGVALLGYGILRMAGGPAYSECIGDGCLDDISFLALPGGIIAMVFGMIIASSALSSIRAARGPEGPLRAFGFMTAFGGLFAVLGLIFFGAANVPNSGTDGTFLFLGIVFGLIGLGSIAFDVIGFRGELKKDRLRLSGLKGSARVVEVHDTNVTVNNSPMVNLDLEVTFPGQAPFRTRKRTVISRLSVGAMIPGATIPVLADPAKPRDIVLDWDATTDSTANAFAGSSFASMFPGAPAGAGMGSSGVNAEILRSVSAALAAAAQRAERGGATTTRTPDGTTIIDGGTTVVVNGQPMQASDLGPTLAGLPGVIAAAFQNAGIAGSVSSIPDANARRGAQPPIAPLANASPAMSGARSSGTLAGAPPPATRALDIPAAGSPTSFDTLPARVTIDGIQDTGTDIGGNRLYTFDLTVQVAGRQSYPAKHAAVVPKAFVARLLRGASFPAHVDPNQPEQISVQWDR